MRMWMGVLALLWALPTGATTWTCVKDFQAVQEGYYEVVGTCSASGTYSTGGDALGVTATAKDTAQAICHTSSQTLVDFVISPSTDGALTTATMLTFDHTNFKLQAFCATPCTGLTSGALPQTISTGCVAAIVTAATNVVCTDQTAAAAVKCTPGTGTIAIAGTGSDAINFVAFPASGTIGECITGVSMGNAKFRFRAVCK